jgi:type I restriction-modification system DNA methylase subunit
MMFVWLLLSLLCSAPVGEGAKALCENLNRVGFEDNSKGLTMAIDVAGYLTEIQRLHASGQATEHTYRPALQKLFDSINDDVKSYNEPKGVKVGRPDFVFIREAGKNAQITVGHCEAKDIGLGINPKGMNDFNKAQHDRYVKALPNLVYTNGLDFRFYKKGELTREISIADFLMVIQPKPDQFSFLENQLKDFCRERLQTITSAEDLAEMMAGKATLIKDILFNTLKEDADLQTELTGQYQSFKKMLIHDLTAEDFSDIYAETIAYGMFGARLHDKTLENFSRVEALELMPKSNPFLRKLFTYVAGPELDERIRRTVDELAEIFQATNLPKLFEDFGKFTQRNDPFIHFYETFLAEYNPAKRKARGVWYTPEPVVNFIVRAVDDVLKSEFGLADGLADTSKVTIDWDTGETKNGKAVTTKKEVHRVQILDPAAGTGTFLAEVIKQIAPKVKDVAEGQWSSYVEKELIPRLHGFELLMASYAMCHMKLDMMLTEMGYKPTANPPRMGVYLTNSLEEGDREIQDLFWAKHISEEAKHANAIKRDMPIMCVIGNPPYSGESANKGDWIMGLMEAYKKEPGGKEKLKERNPKWINDDYVKFIRFAEHLIEKNGEGVLGFITNHGYLDNPTFRGMRWHLLNTFDKIWVLDLHGNAKKKEIAPDGSPDKNVFDIQQGVALIVATKKRSNRNRTLANVFHGEIWGGREGKYKSLWTSKHAALSNFELPKREPQYPFVKRNFNLEGNYTQGFAVQELMPVNSVGIVTARDDLTIDMNSDILWNRVRNFVSLSPEEARQKYDLGDDVRDWRVEWAQADARKGLSSSNLKHIQYRPFDTRWTYYTGNSRGFLCFPRAEVMGHLLGKDNFGISYTRTIEGGRDFADVFVTSAPITHHTLSIKEVNAIAPLFFIDPIDQTRRVNFDLKIHGAIIAAATGPSKPAKGRALQGEGDRNVPDEVAIFDYVYGVLHCPAYRETYKEFLKIGFPRVPYPPSPEVFWNVSANGTQLRKLHLMEDAAIGPAPYKFTGVGDTVVGKVKYEGGRVAINDAQGFDNVPEIAWNFYIGGYQPAQKWLKDRKGRELSFEDIKHYQKIIKILSETDRIMKTIEMPL